VSSCVNWNFLWQGELKFTCVEQCELDFSVWTCKVLCEPALKMCYIYICWRTAVASRRCQEQTHHNVPILHRWLMNKWSSTMNKWSCNARAATSIVLYTMNSYILYQLPWPAAYHCKITKAESTQGSSFRKWLMHLKFFEHSIS
jgi:hypothetical protein